MVAVARNYGVVNKLCKSRKLARGLSFGEIPAPSFMNFFSPFSRAPARIGTEIRAEGAHSFTPLVRLLRKRETGGGSLKIYRGKSESDPGRVSEEVFLKLRMFFRSCALYYALCKT